MQVFGKKTAIFVQNANIVLNNFEKIKKEVGTKERKLLP